MNDLNYKKCYGVEKSKRSYFTKDSNNQNLFREITYQLSQLGVGFNQYIFLPSDSNELEDQLKLVVLEKVGCNGNPMLSKQIIAIAEKLLEYECITTNQHQNNTNSFSIFFMNHMFKKYPFVD